GTRAVSVAWDKTARVWDLRTGGMLRTITLPDDDGRSTRWLPDGRLVTTAGGSADLWDASTGEHLRHFHQDAGVRACAYEPHRRVMLLGDDAGNLKSWDPATGA